MKCFYFQKNKYLTYITTSLQSVSANSTTKTQRSISAKTAVNSFSLLIKLAIVSSCRREETLKEAKNIEIKLHQTENLHGNAKLAQLALSQWEEKVGGLPDLIDFPVEARL